MPTTARPVPFEICDEMWQRVCRNADITDDHWVWTEKARNFWFDGNFWSPTRIAWRAFVGDPGQDELVCLCGVPRCFRPAHRALAPRSTAAGKTAQGLATAAAATAKRARTHCVHGHAFAEHGGVYRGKRYCKRCDADRHVIRYNFAQNVLRADTLEM